MLITTMSAVGGVGKTSLTLALAEEASRRGISTCVVDMDFSPGTMHALFDLDRYRSITDAAGNPEKAVEYVQVPAGKTYGVLSGGLPHAADVMTKPITETMLQTLLQNFQLVIVDTSSQPTEGSLTAVQKSNTTLFVITPERYTGIRGAILLDYIKSYGIVNSNRFEVVINNCRPGKKQKYVDIMKAPVSVVVPYLKNHSPDKRTMLPYVSGVVDAWFPNTMKPGSWSFGKSGFLSRLKFWA
ncbi:hypothetical protein Tfer_0923 [Thermincola ferriacetica]|uniref:Cobyrinic acid ac-diamide synthase n=1 Tax=Thermincola ferriacetica TaxID=281456 RepID=A0A0L6W458_9FIRM|nr:P-loop NTPase [Thermincola ferriacetica]KNZ70362.1 hypothetical protein Tfer_0923 [Thermincola ferriacetica]